MHNDNPSDSGSAYVFLTTDDWNTYTEIKLTAPDAASDDHFGKSVAIDGDTVVVGRPQWYNDGSGSVYLFLTTDGGATYAQLAKLTAPDAAAKDMFGWSVAIDGETVVATAPYVCLLYTSPSPRDATLSRMPSSA